MDYNIHPELSKMRNDFMVAKKECEMGFISVEDLEFLRSNMELIDSAGYHWSVDIEGNYIRWIDGGEVSHTPGRYFARGERPLYSRDELYEQEGARYEPYNNNTSENSNKKDKLGKIKNKRSKKVILANKKDPIFDRINNFIHRFDQELLRAVVAVTFLLVILVVFFIII